MLESSTVELKCYKNFDFEYEVRLVVKNSDKLKYVHRRLRDRLSVIDGEISRLWKVSSAENYESLDLEDTVSECGLTVCKTLVLQTQEGGKWNHTNKSQRTQWKSKEGVMVSDKSLSPGLSEPFKSFTMSCVDSLSDPKGACGLTNLGNTCYMNSVIQCLSNCVPLTEYFLENKHLPELNKTNSLGSRGEIARAFGSLIQQIWSGKLSCTKPLQFKAQIVRFNSQFAGFSQHDAQEFLTYLLDGLHEDLNRIQNRSCFKEKQPFQKDPKISEPWGDHKLRNDSIIVDLFHGLLKSTVICPKCERLSITYDPFCSLSLPLPCKKDRLLKVHFVPKEPSQKELLLKIPVPRKGLFRELCKEVSIKTNSNPDLLVPALVRNFHFCVLYSHEESLDRIEDKGVIHIYEMPEEAQDDRYIVIPVCFWDLSLKEKKIPLKNGFGIPLLLVFLKADLRKRRIAYCILNEIKKRFNLPISNSRKDLTYMPNIYLVETFPINKPEPVQINFDDNGLCTDDLLEMLDHENQNGKSGRKTLIVDLSLEGKKEYLSAFSKLADRCSFKKYLDTNNGIQIYDCIDLFVSCEKLGAENAWYCPICKNHQRASKKFDIWLLPKILVIHLKRFSYSRQGGKLETPIEFPLRNFNLYNYMINSTQEEISYDLIGVINHFGSMSGGHYTAYCRNKTGLWFCFNDSVVSNIDEDRVVNPNAYVLFYSRNDERLD